MNQLNYSINSRKLFSRGQLFQQHGGNQLLTRQRMAGKVYGAWTTENQFHYLAKSGVTLRVIALLRNILWLHFLYGNKRMLRFGQARKFSKLLCTVALFALLVQTVIAATVCVYNEKLFISVIVTLRRNHAQSLWMERLPATLPTFPLDAFRGSWEGRAVSSVRLLVD